MTKICLLYETVSQLSCHKRSIQQLNLSLIQWLSYCFSPPLDALMQKPLPVGSLQNIPLSFLYSISENMRLSCAFQLTSFSLLLPKTYGCSLHCHALKQTCDFNSVEVHPFHQCVFVYKMKLLEFLFHQTETSAIVETTFPLFLWSFFLSS